MDPVDADERSKTLMSAARAFPRLRTCCLTEPGHVQRRLAAVGIRPPRVPSIRSVGTGTNLAATIGFSRSKCRHWDPATTSSPGLDPSVLEPTLHPVLLSLGASKRLPQQRREGASSALRCHWGRQPRAPPPPSDPLPGFICSSAPLWRLASVPLYPPHQLRHTPISIGTVPCFIPTRGGWPPRPPRTALLQGLHCSKFSLYTCSPSIPIAWHAKELDQFQKIFSFYITSWCMPHVRYFSYNNLNFLFIMAGQTNPGGGK